MGIPNNYEINVSKNGKHYCKIEIPDTFRDQAKKKLAELKTMFGEEYKVTMVYWECYSREVKED